jgi:rare lipoprotein A (peptidoglycan hydrolase)
LLQHGTTHAERVAAASDGVTDHGAQRELSVDNVVLPSQLVRYQADAAAEATTTTTALPTPTTSPVVSTPEVKRDVETTAAPVTTTTVTPIATPVTTPPPPTGAGSERGQATWYAAAPPGMCASPTLSFGTVLTVTDIATGARTICRVDDREEAGYPRVVDLSPSGFEQLGALSQGVVDVIISW